MISMHVGVANSIIKVAGSWAGAVKPWPLSCYGGFSAR